MTPVSRQNHCPHVITGGRYYLGCPVWSSPDWRGTVYSANAPKEKWLTQYSYNFNTVEGNSTFYGIPKIETFKRWAEATQPGLKFCLKFPRSISHEAQLCNCDHDLEKFLSGLLVLHEAERLGPTILQMGPGFSPGHFGALVRFLEQLPREFSYAVEVRHTDYFSPAIEDDLNQMLQSMGVDRIIFDSRPLFSAPPSDEFEVKSQQRKPRSPVRPGCTGQFPMLRFVGRNDGKAADPWIDQWVPVVSQWMEQGRTPFVFTHSPNEGVAPQLAVRFHDAMCRHTAGLKPFVDWFAHEATQKSLF